METISKIIKKTLLLAVLIGLFPFLSNQAAAATDKTANCGQIVETKLNDLLSIKDDQKLPVREKTGLELDAKITLLDSIISCSKEEVAEIGSILKDLKNLSEEDAKTRDLLISKLDEFSSYFNKQGEAFDEIKYHKNNSDEISSLAEDIFSWRQTSYAPFIKNAVNFSFFFKQNNIISVAKSRYDKISTSLKRMLSINNKDVTSLLNLSSDKIKQAVDLNNQAFSLIKNNLNFLFATPTPEILTSSASTTPSLSSSQVTTTVSIISSKDSSSATTTPDSLPDNKEKPALLPENLIKQSLDNIKSAYEDFFKISKVVQKILGF